MLCSFKTALREVSKYGVFSGSYFPVFELNTEIYSVNLHIQSECGKIRTRKNSVLGHFLRSAGNQNSLGVVFFLGNNNSRELALTSLNNQTVIVFGSQLLR